jgi:hypothetical protein
MPSSEPRRSARVTKAPTRLINAGSKNRDDVKTTSKSSTKDSAKKRGEKAKKQAKDKAVAKTRGADKKKKKQADDSDSERSSRSRSRSRSRSASRSRSRSTSRTRKSAAKKEKKDKKAATPKKDTPKKKDAPKKSAKPKLNDDQQEAIDGMTVALLKDRLKDNDQVTTGNKGEIISRITDCIVNGCLPRCPKCSGGRLKIRGNGYYCPGYHDDENFVHCSFTADKVDRVPWKKADGQAV